MAGDDPNGGIRYSFRDLLDEIRRDIAGIREELRENRHKLSGELATLALRVLVLEHQREDTLRRLDENDTRARTWIPKLEYLLGEESVAESMKKAGWTKRERMMAYGLVLFAFVGAVGTIVSLIVLVNGGG